MNNNLIDKKTLEGMDILVKRLVQQIKPVIKQMSSIINSIDKPLLFFNLWKYDNFVVVSEKELNKLSFDKEDLTNKSFWNTIINFYSDNNWLETKKLFEEWKQYNFLENRKHLLNSCYIVLDKCKNTEKETFNLIIPTLLSQIDGVCKELVIKLDPITNNNNPRQLSDVNTPNLTEQTFLENFTLSEIVDLLLPISYLFPKKEDDNDTTNKKLEEYKLKRNDILHGEITDYGTQENFIRLILYFDSILLTLDYIYKNLPPK